MIRCSFGRWFQISYLFCFIIISWQRKLLKMFIFYWKTIKNHKKLGGLSHFSHRAETFFSDIFLPFCWEWKVAQHIQNSVWARITLKHSRRYNVPVGLIKRTFFTIVDFIKLELLDIVLYQYSLFCSVFNSLSFDIYHKKFQRSVEMKIDTSFIECFFLFFSKNAW